MKPITLPIFIFVLIAISACANLNPQFEEPQISVSSFKMIPSQGLNPTFEIGLRVVNPNSIDLVLKGMSYTASIAGNPILSGVANQIPILPAYGEETVKLKAQADLLGSVRLIANLMKPRERGDALPYTLKVKLDVGTFAWPIHITREGTLTLPKVD